MVERFGRRNLLIFGGTGMVISQYIVGIIGVTAGKAHADGTYNKSAVSAMIAFICINISMFASTVSIPFGSLPHYTLSKTNSFTVGAMRMGCHRRGLPSPHSIPRSRSVYFIQLVLELYHRNHHPLPRRQTIREPRVQDLLHVGLPLHHLRGLRLLFGP
jgi:hypothetical protein